MNKKRQSSENWLDHDKVRTYAYVSFDYLLASGFIPNSNKSSIYLHTAIIESAYHGKL